MLASSQIEIMFFNKFPDPEPSPAPSGIPVIIIEIAFRMNKTNDITTAMKKAFRIILIFAGWNPKSANFPFPMK